MSEHVCNWRHCPTCGRRYCATVGTLTYGHTLDVEGGVRALMESVRIQPDPPRNTTSYAWGMYDARQTLIACFRRWCEEQGR